MPKASRKPGGRKPGGTLPPPGGVRTDADGSWRNLNTSRLLMNSFAWCDAYLLAALREADYGQVRRTHLNVLRHLDGDGTRMTDLAARANLTKAAMTSLVRACEEMGFVAVKADEGDRRTRLVYFTPKGDALMRFFRDTMAAMERQLRQHLGGKTYDGLRAGLLKLSGIPDVTPFVTADGARRRRA